MILKVESKENKKNNFLSDKDKLKEMGVSSFSDISKDHVNFLLNHEFRRTANDKLAVHIKTSYFYDGWPIDFESYLIDRVKNDNTLMNEAKKLNLLNDHTSLGLEVLWINKQLKHEFNPIHIHHGIFSFIIPLQIPYDLNEEDKIFNVGSDTDNLTSRLTFVKCKNDTVIWDHANLDKSYVNKVLIFSSKLHHMVYPFYTSDEYRITVSGNIIAKD